MKDSKTKAEESIRLAYTGLRHSCCHTYFFFLRYVSFAEVGRICLCWSQNACLFISMKNHENASFHEISMDFKKKGAPNDLNALKYSSKSKKGS